MIVAVLGAGSWGTALAVILARNGHEVRLICRTKEEADELTSTRENLPYLPGFVLPREVEFMSLESDLPECEMWVMATPSGAVRQIASRIVGENPMVVIASKGLEPGTGDILPDVVAHVRPNATVAVLSGPNLAIELARGIPTAALAACGDEEQSLRVCRTFMCRSFRVYISDDVIGVSVAGALKNVLAIAAGMSDGLAFGDNTKGALLARGLRDMTHLGISLGAKMETFFGIAGVGDLFATANSTLSRNYRVGYSLGKGKTLKEALDEVRQVAEGVSTAESAMMLARQKGVSVPIFEAAEAVIRGRLQPKDAVAQLMERMPKREGFLSEDCFEGRPCLD